MTKEREHNWKDIYQPKVIRDEEDIERWSCGGGFKDLRQMGGVPQATDE